jgi:hypothetical protein
MPIQDKTDSVAWHEPLIIGRKKPLVLPLILVFITARNTQNNSYINN